MFGLFKKRKMSYEEFSRKALEIIGSIKNNRPVCIEIETWMHKPDHQPKTTYRVALIDSSLCESFSNQDPDVVLIELKNFIKNGR